MAPAKARAEEFVARLRPLQRPLEVYCRRMLRNPSLTEDVIQSAVAEAFAKYGRDEVRHFKAWIFRFVTLEVYNRNRKHEPVSLGDVPADLSADESWDALARADAFDAMLDDPDAALGHFDDVVVGALARLPAVERAVLLLHAVGEFRYREIHELLSIPLGSVIGYLSRARQRLRLTLADYAAERGLFRPGASSGGPHP
jgi:RNA polymerase sigma-70 factor (ECF subfamily)